MSPWRSSAGAGDRARRSWKGWSFFGSNGNASATFRTGGLLWRECGTGQTVGLSSPTFGTAIYRDDGTHVTGPNTAITSYEMAHIEGSGYVDYMIDRLPLVPGDYEFTAAIYDYHSVHPYDHRHRQFAFRVVAWREP